MTSAYRREHIKSAAFDEFDALSPAAQIIIVDTANAYEAAVSAGTAQTPSAGERLALKRAMARFVIDSGIASSRGWI